MGSTKSSLLAGMDWSLNRRTPLRLDDSSDCSAEYQRAQYFGHSANVRCRTSKPIGRFGIRRCPSCAKCCTSGNVGLRIPKIIAENNGFTRRILLAHLVGQVL